jgi:hypothetical protein
MKHPVSNQLISLASREDLNVRGKDLAAKAGNRFPIN